MVQFSTVNARAIAQGPVMLEVVPNDRFEILETATGCSEGRVVGAVGGTLFRIVTRDGPNEPPGLGVEGEREQIGVRLGIASDNERVGALQFPPARERLAGPCVLICRVRASERELIPAIGGHHDEDERLARFDDGPHAGERDTGRSKHGFLLCNESLQARRRRASGEAGRRDQRAWTRRVHGGRWDGWKQSVNQAAQPRLQLGVLRGLH